MPSVVETMIAQEMSCAQRRTLHPCYLAAIEDKRHPEPDSSLNPLGTPSPFLRLPPELLLHVFKATVPPLYQHDPSVIPGPRNPWLAALRTRKALVLTCKTFFGPATEVLYEDVVFRRMGQIPALARTLGPSAAVYNSNARHDLAPLVRRIRMDGCVIWAPCADVVREDLRLILQRCTSLRSFSFHPHPHFPFMNDPSDLDSWDMFNPSWLLAADRDFDSVGGLLRCRLASSIRTFDLTLTLNESMIEHLQWFLSAAHHLAVLKLGAVALAEDSEDSADRLLDHPTLTLPVLQELQIHASHLAFQQYVAQRWVLPRLRLLTALSCDVFPEPLLAAHGARLTYFHLRHGRSFAWDVSQLDGLGRLHALCPRIEHLVIPTWHRAPLPVHSPTLRFLDVWGHHPPPHIFKAGWYQLAPGNELPRFEKLRILSTMPRSGWGAAMSVDWPLICHPTAVVSRAGSGDDGQRVYDFPGARVLQTSWGVIHDFRQEDLTYSHGDGVERRDNSGGYESDGEGDATSVFSDETESFRTEEEDDADDLADLFGGAGAVEQLGRDRMLEMFHESQDRYFLLEND